MDPRLLPIARRTRGFMPEAEGLALHRAVLELDTPGPLLEVGGYCGLSALYLGFAAHATNRVLFSVDHHRGSEENQAGWEHHDPGLVDPRTGRMDTLPHFRRTIEEAHLEAVVVAVVGESVTVAAVWQPGVALLFLDGGHALPVVTADYQAWTPKLVTGGLLAIHDVFADPADGGQAPFQVWRHALSEGFEDAGGEGSLRFLRKG